VSISEHEAKTLADFETYEAEVATLRARVAELEVELDAARRVIEAEVCRALRTAGFSTSVLTPSGKVEVVSERIERIAAVVARAVKP